jgi:cytidylate kinase
MHFVTFSRKAACGGEEIARKVAERLGYKFYDTEAIDEAAQEMGFLESVQRIDERTPSFFKRMFSHQPVVQLDRLNSVLYELATKGDAVFMGRGSHLLLESFQCGLHVKITASRDKRVQNLMAIGYQEDAAATAVDSSDQERSSFIRYAFGVDWDVPELYDIVLNMDKLSPELAVNTIVNMALSNEIKACSTAALRSMEMVALSYRAQAALMEAGFPSEVVSVSVTDPGQVELRGLMQREATKARAEEVVKAVKGVNAVQNNILISPAEGYA